MNASDLRSLTGFRTSPQAGRPHNLLFHDYSRLFYLFSLCLRASVVKTIFGTPSRHHRPPVRCYNQQLRPCPLSV